MKKLLVFLLASSAWATTITDTVRTPYGSTFTGRIVITSSGRWTSTGGSEIARYQKTVSVTSGAFSESLEPTDTATPSGQWYTFQFFPDTGATYTVRYTVPTSASPITFAGMTVVSASARLLSTTGDVVGPALSVDGEIALFDGITGKLLERATTTGVLKATSGVLSAVSGTATHCVLVNGTSTACSAGGGTGDVVGPASSTADKIVLMDGITGKLIKEASTTGVLKATSGVIGAVSGTASHCVLVDGTSAACDSSAVGGDLSGTLPNPVVAKFQGRAFSATAPQVGQFIASGDGATWAPAFIAASHIASGTFADARVSESSVTQHGVTAATASRLPKLDGTGVLPQALFPTSISFTSLTLTSGTGQLLFTGATGFYTGIRESDVRTTNLLLYLPHTDPTSSLDVPTWNANGTFKAWSGKTNAETLQGRAMAATAPANGQFLASDGTGWGPGYIAASHIASGTLADARISESSVTQHGVTTATASRLLKLDGSGLISTAQIPTSVVNTAQTAAFSFAAAASSIPQKTGVLASRPATCAVGETYFSTDSTAGQNVFGCTAAPSTWTLLGDGGGGSGDVVGPSASVDKEIALFDSTTGKLLERATETGVLKATSGVLGVVSGTSTNCVLVDGTSTTCGTGTGDASTNTSTSVDGEGAVFSGTGGKTIKRFTGTGPVKAVSGVLSTGLADQVNYTDVAITATTSDQPLIELALASGDVNTAGRTFEYVGLGAASNPTTGTAMTYAWRLNLCTVSGCGSGTVSEISRWTTSSVSTGASNSNVPWTVSATCTVKTTGGSGTIWCGGPGGMHTGTTGPTGAMTLWGNSLSVVTIDTAQTYYLTLMFDGGGADTDTAITQRSAVLRWVN